MTLRRFLDRIEHPERSLVVLNRSAPEPIQNMLERMFDGQPIDVEESQLPDAETDRVMLVEGDTVVASSTLDAFADEILLVNSDLFMTGARALEEIEPLPVLERLDEVPFFLRGYPESHSEKMLLILISRYIERLAWTQQDGTIRASFQYLPRIEDEIGTHQVYRQLDESPVDVHVYGAPGWEPTPDSSITIHAGYGFDFLKSWFVIYTPPEEDGEHAALLAIEEGPNRWNGFWTYRQSLVKEIERYVVWNL